MLIEYYATEREDRQIELNLKTLHIENWFNPEDQYYVIDTQDTRVITILCLMGIECWVTETDLSWHEHAFGPNNKPYNPPKDK